MRDKPGKAFQFSLGWNSGWGFAYQTCEKSADDQAEDVREKLPSSGITMVVAFGGGKVSFDRVARFAGSIIGGFDLGLSGSHRSFIDHNCAVAVAVDV